MEVDGDYLSRDYAYKGREGKGKTLDWRVKTANTLPWLVLCLLFSLEVDTVYHVHVKASETYRLELGSYLGRNGIRLGSEFLR